jgi:hypothetical protein
MRGNKMHVDIIELIKGNVEEHILDSLYEVYTEEEIDEMLTKIDSIVSPPITDLIEMLSDAISERFEELENEYLSDNGKEEM